MVNQVHHRHKNVIIIQVKQYNEFYRFKIEKFLILDSESDVNNDHLIGNVQRVAIVPPNYEGKPKKGHLIFDASFECGMFRINI
jgi:hypothetical protein